MTSKILKENLIPWAGSHEYYVNLNGRVHVTCHCHNTHTYTCTYIR